MQFTRNTLGRIISHIRELEALRMLNGVERNGTEKARGSNNDHGDHSGCENGDGDG